MNKGLREYLDKCTPAEIDQDIIDELYQAMKDAIPEIAEAIKERERLADQYRRGIRQ